MSSKSWIAIFDLFLSYTAVNLLLLSIKQKNKEKVDGIHQKRLGDFKAPIQPFPFSHMRLLNMGKGL